MPGRGRGQKRKAEERIRTRSSTRVRRADPDRCLEEDADIWVIGDSIPYWAGQTAKKNNRDANLGLNKTVAWWGIRGMSWDDFIFSLQLDVTLRRAPELVELNKIYDEHFKPNILFKEQTENIVINVEDISLDSDNEDIELINFPITNKLTETCDSDYDDDNDENLCETNTSISVDDVIHNYNCSCSKNCLALFSKEDVKGHIYNLKEYDRKVKDAYIVGALNKI
ncbi:hypothetical protein ACF0H5_011406 [Mactra antiquata]